MIKKIKQEVIDFFKSPKDIISFFTPIVIALILIIPTDYTVTVGGGIINMDQKIAIAGESSSKGSFNSCYVKELNGNVLTYILGKIIPSFTLNKISDITLDMESQDDYEFREKMYFTSSESSSLKVAYTKLGKQIDIVNEDIYVIYKDSSSLADVLVGDKIIKVNGNYVKTVADLNKLVSESDSDTLTLTVVRDNKEKDVLCNLISIDGVKKIGIYLAKKITYKTDPEVTFSFSDREIGPSGGLIMTLSIYNKLTQDDITKGYKISGTGTIDDNGNVGEIGGVKEKLKGAVSKNSDIFICPKENYEEAIKLKEENNYDISIYGVATFDEALSVLESL